MLFYWNDEVKSSLMVKRGLANGIININNELRKEP